MYIYIAVDRLPSPRRTSALVAMESGQTMMPMASGRKAPALEKVEACCIARACDAIAQGAVAPVTLVRRGRSR
ncbi:hypothetical protein [Rhodopseudomonas telluris]|uniref:Uncharacterized protein n=1 Tax=Rhodopseudomonas telluris TaxID=644215 RepID=A0ABV6EUV2_9BRAD